MHGCVWNWLCCIMSSDWAHSLMAELTHSTETFQSIVWYRYLAISIIHPNGVTNIFSSVEKNFSLLLEDRPTEWVSEWVAPCKVMFAYEFSAPEIPRPGPRRQKPIQCNPQENWAITNFCGREKRNSINTKKERERKKIRHVLLTTSDNWLFSPVTAESAYFERHLHLNNILWWHLKVVLAFIYSSQLEFQWQFPIRSFWLFYICNPV